MTDYNNSNKAKEEAEVGEKPKPKIEKVVVGEVIVQKPGISKKLRNLIVDLDVRGLMRYAYHEQIIPKGRNMLYDVIVGSSARAIFKDARQYHNPNSSGPHPYDRYSRPGSRVTLSTQDPRMRDPRSAPPPEVGPRMSSRSGDVFILSHKEDAERVLESMAQILDHYEFVSVAQVNEMMGRPFEWPEQAWGWTHIAGANIRQVSNGYLLELPPIERQP